MDDAPGKGVDVGGGRMKKRTLRTVVVLVALAATGATAQLLPPDVVSQLPDGYEALLVRVADFNADRAKDFLVVAGKRGEEKAIEAQCQSVKS